MIKNGDFNQFDYGDIEINRNHYGTDTPPPYDLTKISAPDLYIYIAQQAMKRPLVKI